MSGPSSGIAAAVAARPSSHRRLMWGNALMDGANKPGRGPVQPGWASTASSPPVGPAQCPILDHSRPYPGERREWAAVPARRPAPSDLERAVAEAAGRSTPTSRRAPSRSPPRGASEMYAAKPQPTMGTKPRRAERSEGANDEPEGQVLVVRGSWPLSSRCWSSPGPPAGSGPPARRPRSRRNSAAVNSPGEWARRSPRYGDLGNSGVRPDGRRCSRMGGTE